MKNFLGNDFMLETDIANQLYNQYAKDQPIIDYHCHINPKDIAENRTYSNISEIWLTCGDHYKWRMIRTAGIDEKYITGNASDYDKFRVWAGAVSKCIGNPLYIWTHMELRKYFGYEGVLNEKTCDEVWERCNAVLNGGNMSACDIINKSNVKLICTTDDPADTLEYHTKIAADNSVLCKVLPAFRPDKSLHIEKNGFTDYIKNLSATANKEINDLCDLYDVLSSRLDFFVSMGCKTVDNGFESVPFERESASIAANGVFKKALNGEGLTKQEIDVYKTELFLYLCEQYKKHDLVMQIHYGVSRNNSTKLFRTVGADAGADAIGNYNCIIQLTGILDTLDRKNSLPKTVLYSINPNDNAALAALIGCYQNSDAAYKLQHGSAWWFNDTNLGMRTQLKNLAEFSNLSGFIGMLTDSRSFLSYTRHDYFRRILCDVIGGFVEHGEYPDDIETLGEIVRNICYYNTKNYFGFNL